MRVWCSGSASAFQADGAGSIPATRSKQIGAVAEWFKATDLKSVEPEMAPWVRIPPAPPATSHMLSRERSSFCYGLIAMEIYFPFLEHGARKTSKWLGHLQAKEIMLFNTF